MQACRKIAPQQITYTVKQSIKTNTNKYKAQKTYYLKPQGRIAIASLFIISAIILGCLYPQDGEGSVFLFIMALIVVLNKDIKIDL